jgi:hypothetical protein
VEPALANTTNSNWVPLFASTLSFSPGNYAVSDGDTYLVCNSIDIDLTPSITNTSGNGWVPLWAAGKGFSPGNFVYDGTLYFIAHPDITSAKLNTQPERNTTELGSWVPIWMLNEQFAAGNFVSDEHKYYFAATANGISATQPATPKKSAIGWVPVWLGDRVYSNGEVVQHTNQSTRSLQRGLWVSAEDSNGDTPGPGTRWSPVPTAGMSDFIVYADHLYYFPTPNSTGGIGPMQDPESKLIRFNPGDVLSGSEQCQFYDFGALDFDLSSSGFSAVISFRFTGAGYNSERLIDFGNGSNDNNIIISRYASERDIEFSIRNGQEHHAVYSDLIIEQDTDVQVICIYNPAIGTNGEMQMYINGNLQSWLDPLASLTSRTLSKTHVGKSHWNGDGALNADIYHISVYNRVLSPFELGVTNENGLLVYADHLDYSPTPNSTGGLSPMRVPESKLIRFNPGDVLSGSEQCQFYDFGAHTLNLSSSGFSAVISFRFTGTANAWEKLIDLNNDPDDYNIFIGRNDSSKTIMFFINNRPGYNIISRNFSIEQDTDVQVICIYNPTIGNNGEMQMYINGALNESFQPPVQLRSRSLRHTYVGKSYRFDFESALNADVYNVSIYDRALSSSEISALYLLHDASVNTASGTYASSGSPPDYYYASAAIPVSAAFTDPRWLNLSSFGAWSSETTYSVGASVTLDNKLWYLRAASSVNQSPDVNATVWYPYFDNTVAYSQGSRVYVPSSMLAFMAFSGAVPAGTVPAVPNTANNAWAVITPRPLAVGSGTVSLQDIATAHCLRTQPVSVNTLLQYLVPGTMAVQTGLGSFRSLRAPVLHFDAYSYNSIATLAGTSISATWPSINSLLNTLVAQPLTTGSQLPQAIIDETTGKPAVRIIRGDGQYHSVTNAINWDLRDGYTVIWAGRTGTSTQNDSFLYCSAGNLLNVLAFMRLGDGKLYFETYGNGTADNNISLTFNDVPSLNNMRSCLGLVVQPTSSLGAGRLFTFIGGTDTTAILRSTVNFNNIQNELPSNLPTNQCWIGRTSGTNDGTSTMDSNELMVWNTALSDNTMTHIMNLLYAKWFTTGARP